MAKKHEFTRVKAWMGDKELPITNYVRIRYHLGYTYKVDENALSNDCYHIFDLEMPLLRMIETMKNEVTVKWQNGRLRNMTESEVDKLYPRGSVVKYDDVYPGKKVRVVSKPMTIEDAKEKCANDPVFREQMKAFLMGDGENPMDG